MTEFTITSEDYSKICRVCLKTGELQSLFNVNIIDNVNITIADAIMACASIQIDNNENFPLQICNKCLYHMNIAYNFRETCEKSDLILRNKYVISDEDNVSIHSLEKLKNDDFFYETSTVCNFPMSMEREDVLIDSEDLTIGCNDQAVIDEGVESELKDADEASRKNRKIVSYKNGFKYFKSSKTSHKNRKPLVCNICKQQFSLRCNLRRHMMLHTGEQPKTHSDDKPYTCHICGKQFSFNCNLRRHLMTHTGERPYSCRICNKGFIQSNNLVNHMRIHTGETPFTCELCQKKFRKSSSLRNHVQRNHDTNKIYRMNKTKDRTVINREHICEICHKTYLSKGALKTHMLIHGDKTFLCSECGKGFVSKPLLQSHSKIHSGIKPYHCTVCDRYFSHYVSLKAHTLIHTGEKPFGCKICGKLFKQRHHLTYHLRTHSGEKPFNCSVCNKSFSLNCNLIVHMRLHSGETPFLCPTCGKGFYDSSSMKKHFRGHKNNSIKSTTSDRNSENGVK